MSSPYGPAIDGIKQAIAEKETAFLIEIQSLKIAANQLCRLAGVPDAYDVQQVALPGAPEDKEIKFREDEFFGKPLATSVGIYFEAREKAGLERPASIDEIYDALVAGGFKFEGNTNNPDNSKRALKIALTKNTAQFVKIGEKFALKKWYGVRNSRKTSSATNKGREDVNSPDDSADAETSDASLTPEVESESEESASNHPLL